MTHDNPRRMSRIHQPRTFGATVRLMSSDECRCSTDLNMRPSLSILTFLLAASSAAVSAYEFEYQDGYSRDVSTSSPSGRLSRRAQDIQDLIAARDLVDSVPQERSILSKKPKKQPATGTTPAQQKAASAELQKWNTVAVNAKKALEALKKKNLGKKEVFDLQKCVGYNEDGSAYFRAISTGSNGEGEEARNSPLRAPWQWVLL